MIKELNKRLNNYNKMYHDALINYSEIQLLNVNEEKEKINQEIVELKKIIKETQINIRRKKRYIKNNVSFSLELEEMFNELENNINLLNEKICQLNSL